MTALAKTVLQKALRLDSIERAELIDALLRSFDVSGDTSVDAKWASEAESRIDALHAGKITFDSAAAVLRRIGKR